MNENGCENWDVPLPPWNALLPLHLLEDFLTSLPGDDDVNNDPSTTCDDDNANHADAFTNTNHHQRHQIYRNPNVQERQDQILQAADFLYGNMLTSALSLLDSSQNMITKVTAAPSHRSLFLVKASSGGSSYNRHRFVDNNSNDNVNDLGNANNAGVSTPSYYVCLLPTSSSRTDNANSIYFCSCRSFYEHSKSLAVPQMMTTTNYTTNNHTTAMNDDGNEVGRGRGCAAASSSSIHAATNDNRNNCRGRDVPICKHLLALVLMPHLQAAYQELTLPSDDDFATIVLDRAFPTSSRTV